MATRALSIIYLTIAVPLLQLHAGAFWYSLMGWQGPSLSILMGVAEVWAWAEVTGSRGVRLAWWAIVGAIATGTVASPAALESAKPVFERMAEASARQSALEAQQAAAQDMESLAGAGIKALAADRQSTLDEWQRPEDREQSRETTREGIQRAQELACLKQGLNRDCESPEGATAWSVEGSEFGAYVPLVQAAIYLIAAMLVPMAVTRTFTRSRSRREVVREAMAREGVTTLRGFSRRPECESRGITATDLDRYINYATERAEDKQIEKALNG